MTRRGALAAIAGGASVGPKAIGRLGVGVGYSDNAVGLAEISPLAQKAMNLFHQRQHRKQIRSDVERQAVHIGNPLSITEKRSWSPAFKAQMSFEVLWAEQQDVGFDFYNIEDAVAQKIIDALS